MNIVEQVPAKTRSVLYLIVGVLTVAAGAVNTWYATVGEGVPAWVTGATAVLAYVAGTTGLIAAGNTDVTPSTGRHAADMGQDVLDVE